MNPNAFSLFLIILSLSHCIAKQDDETLKNVPKRTPASAAIKAAPFNIDEACKNSTAGAKCATLLKSLGGDKDNVKASKFIDRVVKEAQSEFGKVSAKAREEMRKDDEKVAVKRALSNCVKFYLDMNDELRGLMAVGLEKSNYGTTTEDFSKMAQNYPRLCEEGLKHAGSSGMKLDLYGDYKELEDLGNIVISVTRYVSANSTQKPAEGDENAGKEKRK